MQLDTIGKLESGPLQPDLLIGMPQAQVSVVESREDLLKTCRLGHVPICLRLQKNEFATALVSPRVAQTDDTLTISLQGNESRVEVGQTLPASFELFREFYVFAARIQSVTQTSIAIMRPDNIYRVHQRQLDRIALPQEDRISVRLREVTGRREFSASVINLTPRGLGLEIAVDERIDKDRMMAMDQHVVLEPTIPRLRSTEPVPGKIVHWRTPNGDSTVQLGVSCSIPLALGDERSLEDFLLERKYPNVRRAVSDEHYEAIWRLLNLSFETIHAAPDPSRKQSSIITWKKASWSPRPINRLYLLERRDQETKKMELVGTIAASRFYSRTWLIHQLGVDGTKGQMLSHQLYARVLDYLRHTDEARFTIGTWPKQSRVFQKYYVDFALNDPARDCHYLEETNILEFDCVQAFKDLKAQRTRETDISVAPFESRFQSAVLGDLQKRYPPVFLSGLDLRPYDMLLADAQGLYEKVALRRERRILVATRKGEFAGFAILEWGSEDQNVFSLFDNFRLYAVSNDVAINRSVKQALLLKIFEIYCAKGVSTAISWTKDAELIDLIPSGKVFYEVYLWVANAIRMKAFLRHLDRLHGRTQLIRSARASRTR